MQKLGFDFNWNSCLGGNVNLLPAFEEQEISREADGAIIKRDGNGLIVRVKPGVVSIFGNGSTLTDGSLGRTLRCRLPILRKNASR